MKFILLSIVLGAATGLFLYLRAKKRNNDYDDIDGTGYIVIFSFLFLILSFIVVWIVPDEEYRLKPVSTIYLESMVDGHGVKGNFFLGSGSVNDIQYYYYYKKSGHGYVQDKIETYRAKLVYTDDKPRIEIMDYQYSEDPGKTRWFDWCPSLCGRDCIIYIPKGSIKNYYEFDLK